MERIKKIIEECVEEIESEAYKIAVKLKLEGFKLKEIAEITGKTFEAIKNDYKRGKKELEEKLKKKGYVLK